MGIASMPGRKARRARAFTWAGRPYILPAIVIPLTSKRHAMWRWNSAGAQAVVVIVLLVFAICGCSSEQPSNRTSLNGDLGRHYSDDEKRYNSTAMNYLRSLADSDAEFVRVMNGASTGESTMEDIHRAVLSTRAQQDQLWSTFEKVEVPRSLASSREDFERNRELHQAAFREYLAYWADGGLEHIPAAGRLYAIAHKSNIQCLEGMKAAISLH